ncbi:hypothetical protein N3K66_004892 [Trichothecium roseum]|uniref:Uncharacterized protein n=1 Tax=Trichothecium roseum TaxID=47278 RepID=A0ACC0V2K8_9HYPO|nr:hypothetical protein N3K66_004892 [Trichothecium roseum]
MLVRIEVHVDTLCPWCYIQKKSLDAAVARYQAKYPAMEFELLYRPFYLYPFLHTTCPKKTLYETAVGPENFPAWRAKILSAASPHGLTFSSLTTGTTGPSRPSHTLLSLALQQRGPAAQSALLDALLQGHFELGKDIFDEAWLAEVATGTGTGTTTETEGGPGVGLDAESVARALASPEAAREVDDEAAVARAERAVEAVPCVTMQGRYRVGGYQDAKVFEDLFEKIYREELS